MSGSQEYGFRNDVCFCFFQAEDGIRDLVRSRGLGDVYKRQALFFWNLPACILKDGRNVTSSSILLDRLFNTTIVCLLYTSDAADERSSVVLGGRRIIKKKKMLHICRCRDPVFTRDTVMSTFMSIR